jgi:hypothetical protein
MHAGKYSWDFCFADGIGFERMQRETGNSHLDLKVCNLLATGVVREANSVRTLSHTSFFRSSASTKQANGSGKASSQRCGGEFCARRNANGRKRRHGEAASAARGAL